MPAKEYWAWIILLLQQMTIISNTKIQVSSNFGLQPSFSWPMVELARLQDVPKPSPSRLKLLNTLSLMTAEYLLLTSPKGGTSASTPNAFASFPCGSASKRICNSSTPLTMLNEERTYDCPREISIANYFEMGNRNFRQSYTQLFRLRQLCWDF